MRKEHFLLIVTDENVKKKMLNVTKATGLDVISARFLRKILKQAKMSPIYKKGNKSDPSIYITVSILSEILKVLKKSLMTKSTNTSVKITSYTSYSPAYISDQHY